LAAEADDLAQEVLIRVLGLAEKRKEGVEFSSFYLRRTAHAVVVDEIRRRRRRQEVPLEDIEGPPASIPSSIPDPERRSASRDLGRAITQCLGSLIRPRRIAVSLHLQGHGIKDVASLMGFNEKRAENLVYRGLADLRCCLESQESISFSEAPSSETDSIAPDVGQTMEKYPGWNELLGPFYTEDQLAKLLGASSSRAVASLRDQHKLLALKTADGVFVYPTMQFDHYDHVIENLPAVLELLGASGVDDWTLAGWLVSSMPSLEGKSPIEWLREGRDRRPVLALAKGAAERFSR
jgi:RNA polymerase sigma-70 factor (ECF subfamily)